MKMADEEGESYCCDLFDDDGDLGQHQLPDLVDDLDSEHLHPAKPTESEESEISEAAKSVFSNTNWSLKKEQIVCIRNLIFGKRDVVALLPTGFGKSIIYQILPAIHKRRGDAKHVVLVVTPLNAIMTEQAKILNSRGIKASILGGANLETEGEAEGRNLNDETIIKQGKIDVVFGSAENWMDPKWQKELKEGVLGKVVSEIAIDEVHCVIEWYDPLFYIVLLSAAWPKNMPKSIFQVAL